MDAQDCQADLLQFQFSQKGMDPNEVSLPLFASKLIEVFPKTL